MNHLKNICLIVLIMSIFIRCTEIYNPVIDSQADALIVEGLITDGTGPFTVKLSKSVIFTSDSASIQKEVPGAKLTISDNEYNTFELNDKGFGKYTLPVNFKAKTGNSYTLHIETTDGNIYESNVQQLLPSQSFDSIRGYYTTQGYMNMNSEYKNVGGADIKVDLLKPVTGLDSMPRSRFSTNITVQYFFALYNPLIVDWHWAYFGWLSLPLNGIENITDEKALSSGIKNHSLGFMPFGIESYGFNTSTFTSVIYYLRVDQYTLNYDSYLFYQGANKQLAASGKIFDPVTAQLYGNMKCINHPSKTVLGLFEVSSVIQQAFVVSLLDQEKSVVISKVPYIDIPDTPQKSYKVWDGNPLLKPKDSLFIAIPFPNWWYHD